MNKKLLALAIAAALAPVAAMADSGNVTISGVMHMSVDSLDNGAYRNTNISSNSSKISFAGNEDLGNGLKAVWNVDSYVRLDNSGSTLGDGNTYAGLSGGFGTAILGKHDTPMKLLGRKVDLFGDQIGDARNMTNPASAAGWDIRPQNVVAYISPNMGGFTGVIAHVTNLADTAATDVAGNLSSVTAWSALGTYEAGPMVVGLAYEKHKLNDFAAGANNEKAYRLAGGYNLGDVKLVALYQKVSDIAGGNQDQKTWGLGAAYKMGATTIKGQYYNASDLTDCGAADCSQTAAKMLALGVDYSLSKRTTAYVAYAKTNNDNAAAFSAFGGGHGDKPAIAAGNDPKGFSLGMKHTF